MNWSQSSITTDVWNVSISGNNAIAGSINNNGIFYSQDGGQNWLQSITTTEFWDVSISGSNAIAGSTFLLTGIFYSQDGGQTWLQSSIIINLWSVSISGSNVIAGSNNNNGIWYSQLPQYPCLLACSSVLLSDYTYKPISQVTSDDSVLCPFSKQPKKIKRCRCNVVDLKLLDSNNFPYRIPKGFFTPTIPEKDVFISGFHRIIAPSIDNIFDWIQTHRLVPDEHKITNEEDILKITGESEVKYYHIELEGGKGGMFVDGLPVETLGENE